MSKTWQFIPTNESGMASNDEARRRVRENAMRDYRRNERLTRTKKHAKEQNFAPSRTSLTPQGSTAGQNQRMVNMHVESLRGPSFTFDLLSMTALPKTNDARRLLQYCKLPQRGADDSANSSQSSPTSFPNSNPSVVRKVQTH